MPEPNYPIYRLSDEERNAFQKLIEENIPEYKVDNYDQFSRACQLLGDQVPESVKSLKEKVTEEGFGLLKNLPIGGALPATPTYKGCREIEIMFTNSVIGVISSLFGRVYTFEGKTTPRHIHDVYPVYGDELTQLGSSNNKLEWHVEDGFHALRANWVALFCLRGDQGATTKLARAKDLVISDDQYSLLTKKEYQLRIDDSFGTSKHNTYVKSWVFSGRREDPEIIFDPAYTVIENEQMARALKAVDECAYDNQLEFVLESGDLLLFDNRKVIHGRTSYHPKMDGNDRWLKRTLILKESMWQPSFINGEVPIQLFI